MQPDRVVREIDVCLSPEEPGAQIFLLQFPLRPHFRPYDLQKLQNVMYKQKAGRLEMEIPLEAGSNYAEDADHKLKAVRFRSTAVDLQTGFCAGVFQNGRLVLLPLHGAMQMRPSLGHVDAAAKVQAAAAQPEAAAAESKEVDPKRKQYMRVEVKKRETERQQEARLQSYAYLSKLEADEHWTALTASQPDGPLSETLWHDLMGRAHGQGGQRPACSLSRQEYLDAFMSVDAPLTLTTSSALALSSSKAQVNVTGQLTGPPATASAAGTSAAVLDAASPRPHGKGPRKRTAAAAAADDAAQPVPAAAGGVGAPARAAMPQAMVQLFKDQPVTLLADIRAWLKSSPSAGDAAAAAEADDPALQDVVLGCGIAAECHGRFLLRCNANATEDSDIMRNKIIQLLQRADKGGSFKKSELMAAFKGEKLDFSNTVFQRVVKTLCYSANSSWHLKPKPLIKLG